MMKLIGIIERGHFVANPGLGDIDCEEFCDYARRKLVTATKFQAIWQQPPIF